MPINKITAPSEIPASVDDYAAQNNLLEALLLSVQGAQRIVGSNVAKGAVFLVGGATYLADADTAISGSASDYVKLTPSVDGLTLAPSYVADLTGVAWNSTYNGYYDASGNLYVFDELKALSLGTITTAKLRDIGLKNLGAGWATVLLESMISLHSGAAGSYDTASVTAGNSWVIPAGMIMLTASYTLGVLFEIYSGSAWVGPTASPHLQGGLFISDGSNFRLRNSSGYSTTIYYRKLL